MKRVTVTPEERPEERIGVYICECGPNIKEAVDVDELLQFAAGLEHVVFVKPFRLLCSGEGQALIGEDVKRHSLTRVVIAACSPKEHEHTFKAAVQKAGLNPFLMQIANIREQAAWVIPDRTMATKKAKAIITGAVRRSVYHEALEKREIDSCPDVLVVGAGVAGISAALTMAGTKRLVYLVERWPCIGGRVAQYEDIFPNMECASCLLDPLLDEVLNHERIKLLTLSEVEAVAGYFGNFTVQVNRKARFVDPDTCLGCGACFEVCPVEVRNEFNEGLDRRKAIYVPYAGALPNVAAIDKAHCLHFQGQGCKACQEACPFGCINYEEQDRLEELQVGAVVLATGFDLFDPLRAPEYGYGRVENVYTSLEFERLVNSTGPTGGKILLKNGEVPKTIALVHCVGSRTPRYHEHCSGVCCMYSLKFAQQIMRKSQGTSIVELYSDFCLPEKESQSFCNTVAAQGAAFVRMRAPGAISISQGQDNIVIEYEDGAGQSQRLTADMVVLAPAMEGAEAARGLAEIFEIPLGKGGFFVEASLLDPVSTGLEGVMMAGCAQGPKDIRGSIAQGQGAAGRVLSRLIPGEKIALEETTAVVDEALCSGCRACIGVCPYKAIEFDHMHHNAKINELLCRGCGACAAICPSSAIEAKHFTDEQISEEIRGLVRVA